LVAVAGSGWLVLPVAVIVAIVATVRLTGLALIPPTAIARAGTKVDLGVYAGAYMPGRGRDPAGQGSCFAPDAQLRSQRP
jgi:hypothetical protein